MNLPRRGRPPKQAVDGAAVQERLLEAAAAEFSEVGYFATSGNRIAGRAGLAAGTFHNYFADKTAALLAVYARWVDEEWRLVEQVLALPALSWPARLALLVPGIVEHHRRWHRLRHALAALTGDEPRVAQARNDSRIRQIEHVLKLTGQRPSKSRRAEIAVRLISFQAVADCIASGDAGLMGLDEAALHRLLIEQLLPLKG